MKLIDFTDFPKRKKTYGGANGNKLSIIYNNELYMLKLPTHASHNKNLSYSNSAVSEYLGCKIFQMLGFETQEVVLGKYTYKGIERMVVACKDFESNNFVLKDFASVKNQIIDSDSNGYGTELGDILETIQSQMLTDPVFLSDFFWDMFIVDAILGNWDRHNGNWGFLYNQVTDEIKLAPVFDCGSCLFPQIDESLIEKLLKDKQQFNARIYDFPTSALNLNNKKINYYSFIKSHEYKECDNAIERIKQKIDINKINELIDSVDCISLLHRQFLKEIIKARIEKILY